MTPAPIVCFINKVVGNILPEIFESGFFILSRLDVSEEGLVRMLACPFCANPRVILENG